jgi:hypothetical protein
MSVSAIFAGIIAIAKAVPKVAELINQFYDLWVDYQLSKIEAIRVEKKHKIAVVIKSIKYAKNDEERKALSSVLADINKL